MFHWAKGPLFPRMTTFAPLPALPATRKTGWILAAAGALVVAAIAVQSLIAQVEGDRGIAPVASSTDITIGGIEVNATGKDAEDAPGQVLDRNGEGEGAAGPALLLGDGQQPEAETMAYAHGQGHDDGAADQHLGHGKVSGGRLHPMNVTNRPFFCSPKFSSL